MTKSASARVFISWEPSNSRSATLAAQFDASCHHIHYLGLKKPLLAPLKYILQSIKTWQILTKSKPVLVFVQNPPIFAPLAVWLYCVVAKSAFIIDSHTGAFLEAKWKWLGFLHGFLVRRANVSIVTNDLLGRMVAGWGGKYFAFPDVPTEFPDAARLSDVPKNFVTVVNSFSYDEPLDQIIEAARLLPEVNFAITGDTSRCPAGLAERASKNIRFTGFMSKKMYVDTLKSSDLAVVLTTENHTMQRGAYEAMSLQVPVVTSAWPLLKDTFFKGVVHTDNTALGIAAGIEEILKHKDRYRSEIADLKRLRRATWQRKLAEFSSAYLSGDNRQESEASR